MEGQIVDNSTSAQSQVPAAPEPVAAPATEPVQPQQDAVPGARSMDTLHALLDGADPNTLFNQQTAAAATPPQTEPEPVEPTPSPVSEPSVIDQIPAKFKNPDGTVNTEALLKSYVGLERVLGEQGTKMGTLERQLREAQPPAQPKQEPAPQAQPEPAPEPEWTPPTIDEYYEDPLGAMEKMMQKQAADMQKAIQEAVKPLAPLVESHQYTQQVNHFTEQVKAFAETNPDIYELGPEMERVVQDFETQGIDITKMPNAVRHIYNEAKVRTVQNQLPPQAPPTIEDMLKDPAMRAKILADPNITAEITKGYVNQVADGAPPVVIGTQPGGTPISVPSEKPRSAREASSMFSRFLKSQ